MTNEQTEMVNPPTGQTEMIAPNVDKKERAKFNAIVWSAEGLRHFEANSKVEIKRQLTLVNAELVPSKTLVIHGRTLRPQLKTIVTF